MNIQVQGAREHNLRGVDVEFGEGLTVVTGISGSGKTSLVIDTLYHEARRRFLEVFELGSPRGRLAPANVDAIIGLGPAVAVGQNLLNRNPNSTMATASGLHPFLRLLYAHFGERSCPRCGMSLSVYSEDEILECMAEMAGRGTVSIAAPLVHEIRGSHRTLLAALGERFEMERIWVDGEPWQGEELEAVEEHDIEVQLRTLEPGTNLAELRSALLEVIAFGSQAVTLRWEGQVQQLARSPVCIRCGAWFGELRPVDFNRTCPACSGVGCQACHETGLPPIAAATRWAGLRFPELFQLSVDEALELFIRAEQNAAITRLRREITQRLVAMQRVGLGYIHLDRPAPTLSRGEAQRVRLGLTLISRLEDMLHILDEPTVGQHPADIQRLLPAFRELTGPVVFVEHDRTAAAGADQAVELGPGAGHTGGQIIFRGTPEQLWLADTATGQYFSQRKYVQLAKKRSKPDRFLTIRDAYLRNLNHIDVPIPLERFTVITGVSGSGKSTLVEDVLVPSLLNLKPTGCKEIDGPQIHPTLVDQSPIGRNPRSNPATYTKLSDIIRDLFAGETGLPAASFSFNRPEGACSACGGLGAVEVSMRYLPSTWIACSECEGLRFTDSVLAARLRTGKTHLSIAEFYQMSIGEVREFFLAETRLPAAKLQTARQILDALCEIGLGYLTLGQASTTLSGGEAQRVKLARYLGKKSLAKDMLVLDEPTTGLHPQDLAGLLGVLDRLVKAGATIVVVEHNTDVIRAADWAIDLGPGAGSAGGKLLYSGPPEGLIECSTSLTGLVLREESKLVPSPLPPVPTRSSSQTIAIRGARVHNLQNVSVEIPKRKLTVVTGLSGSGKSSLVHDVLEAEARRRYLESLSLYERQGLHEGAEAEVEAVTGLGVALTIGAERLVYSRRATVGTATGISPHLAVLLAAQGERECLECGSAMERGKEWVCRNCKARSPMAAPRHFSPSTYAAACQTCNGVGSLQVPNPGETDHPP
jgi:excinuclease ABC subunit A